LFILELGQELITAAGENWCPLVGHEQDGMPGKAVHWEILHMFEERKVRIVITKSDATVCCWVKMLLLWRKTMRG
jgi:hypothetical protein